MQPGIRRAYLEMKKESEQLKKNGCPNCGSSLVIKQSKYGKFLACSNYPECKYIKHNEKKEVKEIIACPKCDGKIIEKKTKKGKIFYGCSNYPKCDFASWDEPIEESCPN